MGRVGLILQLTFYFHLGISFDVVAQIYPDQMVWSGCNIVHNGYFSGQFDSLCQPTELKLVMFDDFDGNMIDETMWQLYYPWGRSLHSKTNETGWEKQYYTDSNVSVSDGKLHLKTKVSPGLYPEPLNETVNNVFFKYTSGMVYSKQGFRKGKFEMRGKIPNIDGLWPAFWLYGECQQEIDIFEFNNKSETSNSEIDAANMIMTHHKSYDCKKKSSDQCEHPFRKIAPQNLSLDYHIYSVEWNEYKIIWRLDGEIMREVYYLWAVSSRSPHGALYASAIPVRSCRDLQPESFYTPVEPFVTANNPMHVILNTAVLYDRAGKEGILPSDFIIDYVKVYEEVLKDKEKNSLTLHLYPNPGNGLFFLEIGEMDISTISIRNIFGVMVSYSVKKENGKIIIDISQNPSGSYFFECKLGRSLIVKL